MVDASRERVPGVSNLGEGLLVSLHKAEIKGVLVVPQGRFGLNSMARLISCSAAAQSQADNLIFDVARCASARLSSNSSALPAASSALGKNSFGSSTAAGPCGTPGSDHRAYRPLRWPSHNSSF